MHIQDDVIVTEKRERLYLNLLEQRSQEWRRRLSELRQRQLWYELPR